MSPQPAKPVTEARAQRNNSKYNGDGHMSQRMVNARNLKQHMMTQPEDGSQRYMNMISKNRGKGSQNVSLPKINPKGQAVVNEYTQKGFRGFENSVHRRSQVV